MIHIKIYSSVRKNIKDIFIFFALLLILGFLFFYRFPYYIDAPGGITNLNDRFIVKGAVSSDGSYNLSYVSEYDGTPILLLYALINPNWDIIKEKDMTYGIVSMEDLYKIDKINLDISTSESVIVAYKKAGKKVTIKSQLPIVMYINEDSDNDLKIGDVIKSVEGIEIDDLSDVSSILNTYNVGDKVKIQVTNDDKEYERYAYIYEEKNKKIIGITCGTKYVYYASPEIKFTIKKNEYGSSGGLMTSLAIYDSLVDEDLTHGLTIVGTGTIDINGNVGEIGGVKYKLKGAVNNDADIFFVPNGSNYDEAMKLKKEKGYEIDIVGVSTLDEAIEYLENL